MATNLLRNFPEEFKVKLPDFSFTQTVNVANAPKLEHITELENVINQHLKITDYSATIKHFIFGYILLDRNVIRLPDNDYISRLLPKTKTIEVGLNLDYEEFVNADAETAKKRMTDKFLWSIKHLLSKRKDFDWQRFYDDCVKLLQK